MRATYQQRVIYEAVHQLNTHPRAEDVYNHVAKQHPTIGRATVYRNLNQMVAAGKLLNIGKMGDGTRYDQNCHPHYHFKCKSCGRVFDVEGFIRDIYSQVRYPEGFHIDEHVIHFYGVCQECMDEDVEGFDLER